jgi:hypothetical protein
MKNYSVSMAFVSSLVFISASMGCSASSPAPESSGEAILVNEESQAPLPGVEMRLERGAGEAAFSLKEGADWKTVAPGVFELPAGDGKSQHIAVGEAGHRWLVEQAGAELDGLYAQRNADDGKPELEQQIASAEEKLSTAHEALTQAIGGPAPQAVSCNISLYAGPSSPVFGTAGAAAVAQIVCGGGCVTFTVSSQTCCSGACTPFSAITKTVCATPQLMGTLQSGFGIGSALVSVNPSGASLSNSGFFCQ